MGGQEAFVLAPLAALASALFCRRHPAAATIAAFAFSGTYGSLQAFTGLSGALFVDLLLVGLWISVILTAVSQGRRRQLVIWPAMLAVVLYLALTLVRVLFAENPAASLLSFRLSGWYLLAMLLIAYAGWDRVTYRAIARGVCVVGGLVGAYAALRWVIGPATAEVLLGQQVAGGYNIVDGRLRVFGSFSAGHQLGFWAAGSAPFCLGAALVWKGRWRAIAGAAFLLLAFAVFLSEIRGGFVGLIVGCALVLVLYQMARSVPSVQVGRTAIVSVGCVAALAVALLVTAGATGTLDRYANILEPSEDTAYFLRELKWTEAMEDIEEHPFGQGVGSASINPAIYEPFHSVAIRALDNSYLKVAYEQGFAVMLLFIAAMALLLLKLCISAIRTRSSEAAGIGLGAAGSLAAALTVFYAGLEIEDLIALGPWMITGIGAAYLIGEQSGASGSVAELVDPLQQAGGPALPRTPSADVYPPRQLGTSTRDKTFSRG